MKPYVPGKPIEELERELGIHNASKIASNENPLGPSPLVVKALENALPQIGRYPDGAAHNLTRALSKFLGFNSNQIILGNGSNELLVLLGQLVLCPGDEVLFSENTFFVYTLTTQLFEGTPKSIPMKNFTHDLQGFTNALSDKTRLVFICNPNNPTGTIVSNSEIESFLKSCPSDVLVVLDEAYYEYVEDPKYFESLKLIQNYPNLVILRTFSKAYALAGLRIGYGIAHPDLVEVFQKTRQPFNVNALAMVAAEMALTDRSHVKKVVELNNRMRMRLMEGLSHLGIRPIPTQANFIYFELEHAPEIYQELLKKGIIVRPLGLKALRVTTGTETETQNFLNVIEELLMVSEIKEK